MKITLIYFLILISFIKTTPKNDFQKIIGDWQLYEFYYDGKNKLNLEHYADCEKKETLQFKDSIYKNITYSSFGTKCFKEINTSKYKITNDYNSGKNEWEYIIKVRFKGQYLDLIIIELNDSILKIGTKNHPSLKDFNQIKTYKKTKKSNSK
ncbi:lipocalin family protein [Flavobacterium sp. SUN052]|uniref:lipocalin family protein n=1 Tax=Flavobacterium sp. SUN052 TaxID=3002441 RepID=UPI00237E42B9|nr:lipocalin family protein [Flavobacterium sp. SUN052]MEC4003633.1 lipocalin family protein [Flavobacterium sp. SUN052]